MEKRICFGSYFKDNDFGKRTFKFDKIIVNMGFLQNFVSFPRKFAVVSQVDLAREFKRWNGRFQFFRQS